MGCRELVCLIGSICIFNMAYPAAQSVPAESEVASPAVSASVPAVVSVPILTPGSSVDEMVDHYHHVKKIISDVYKDTSFTAAESGLYKDISLCDDAVTAVQNIFTHGCANEQLSRLRSRETYRLNDTPWVIPYSYLLSGTPPLTAEAQSFFTPAHKEEHILYAIGMGGHIFLVEKQSNTHTSYWRVYQGWHGLFTLGSWLGIDPWKFIKNIEWVNQDQCTLLHGLYGNGKKLDAKEIHAFLQGMISVFKEKRREEYVVTAYSVDPKTYAAVPECAT